MICWVVRQCDSHVSWDIPLPRSYEVTYSGKTGWHHGELWAEPKGLLGLGVYLRPSARASTHSQPISVCVCVYRCCLSDVCLRRPFLCVQGTDTGVTDPTGTHQCLVVLPFVDTQEESRELE